VPTSAPVPAFSAIEKEAEEITGGLFDATMLMQTIEVAVNDPASDTEICKQYIDPNVNKLELFFATEIAPVLLIAKTGFVPLKVLLEEEDDEIEYVRTLLKSASRAVTEPTTVPTGAFWAAFMLNRLDVNQGGSFTSVIWRVQVLDVVMGGPSIPSSVTDTITVKLEVLSKSNIVVDLMGKEKLPTVLSVLASKLIGFDPV
jgi:hypothetical protein